MIKIDLPSIGNMEKVVVILKAPRNIINKGRIINKITTRPSKDDLKNIGCVYIICEGVIVEYIGETSQLRNRMSNHIALKKNKHLKTVYILREEDKKKRMMYETVYKVKYLGRTRISDESFPYPFME